MDQLVDCDVLKALDRLLGEFEIEPDTAGFHVATPPLGFHLFDGPVLDLYAQPWLPLLQKRWYQGFQLGTIPAVEQLLALLWGRIRPSVEVNIGLLADLHPGWPRVLDEAQAIAVAEEIMALAADHLTFGLSCLAFKSRPLALDPAELADHREPNGVVIHRQRSGHAHPSVRGINAQVKVLDRLADDVDR